MSPLRALLLPGLSALALALLLPASEALAQCAPDPASDGDTVTCDADDTDGFVAGVNNIDMTVQAGVTVSSPAPAANDTIDLDDTSLLTIEATATVTATDTGRNAVSIGDDNDDGDPDTAQAIQNLGAISSTDGDGILMGERNEVLNAVGGSISTGAYMDSA